MRSGCLTRSRADTKHTKGHKVQPVGIGAVRRLLDELEGAGAGDGLRAARGVQLVEDGVHVALDRAGGDAQAVGDLAIGAAVGHEAQHLHLAVAERLHDQPILGGGDAAVQGPIAVHGGCGQRPSAERIEQLRHVLGMNLAAQTEGE